MSKTYKTRPLHVRITDAKDQRVSYKEVHDHRTTECDLPPRSEAATHKPRTTTCYYDFHYVGAKVCACTMCSDRTARKASARHNRHATKDILTEARKDVDLTDNTSFPERYTNY